jgi:CO dehydrogenase maturation factor
MRVAFVGKGGSGKTTLSALFARHLAHSGAPVVAIDGDIDQHLAEALGLSDGESFTAPPHSSRLLRLLGDDACTATMCTASAGCL